VSGDKKTFAAVAPVSRYPDYQPVGIFAAVAKIKYHADSKA
jgi:hypothetical protein